MEDGVVDEIQTKARETHVEWARRKLAKAVVQRGENVKRIRKKYGDDAPVGPGSEVAHWEAVVAALIETEGRTVTP